MGFYGAVGEVQLGADFLGRQALAGQNGNLAFPNVFIYQPLGFFMRQNKSNIYSDNGI